MKSRKKNLKFFFCYSNNNQIRRNGASGGMVTTLLKYLLENNIIDGVLTISYNDKLSAEYKIMTTVDEVISCQKSKYFYIPFNIPIKEIIKYKRLAVVSLPCYLKALNNILTKRPELNRRIYLKIGLFCSHVQKRMFYEHLLKKERISEIKKIKFRPGDWWEYSYFDVIYDDKHIKRYEFKKNKYVAALITSRIFSMDACIYCKDFTAKSSDISFGDGWHPMFKENKEGINFAIVHSKRANKIIGLMEKENMITIIKTNGEEISYLSKVYQNANKQDNKILLFIYFKIKWIAERMEEKNIQIPLVTYFLALLGYSLLNFRRKNETSICKKG